MLAERGTSGLTFWKDTFNNAGDLIDVGFAATGMAIVNNSGNVTLSPGAVGDAPTTLTVQGGSATGTFNVPARTQLWLNAYTFNAGAQVAGDGETRSTNLFVIAGDQYD